MNRDRRVVLDGVRVLVGIAICAALTACDGGGTNSSQRRASDSHGATASNSTAGHSHEHHAPHGGTLIELGEEFAHVELMLDDSTGTLTAYVLDGEAEHPVRLKDDALVVFIKAGKGGPELRVELTAIANKLTGEQRGDTSEFRGTEERMRGQKSFSGRLERIAVKGQEFKDVPLEYPKGSE